MKKNDEHRADALETKAERIGSLIEKLFKSRRISREPRILEELKEVWEKAVGPDLATRLSPAMFRAETVWIKVDSSALFFEMRNFASEPVLRGIQEVMPGCVRGVRFFQ